MASALIKTLRLGVYAYLYIRLFNLAIYSSNRPFYEFINPGKQNYFMSPTRNKLLGLKINKRRGE